MIRCFFSVPAAPVFLSKQAPILAQNCTKKGGILFARWLKQQAKRQDPVGGLARLSRKVGRWPTKGKQKDDYQKALENAGYGRIVILTLDRAWDEFTQVA